MSKIVIDARRLHESTGRYMRGVIPELERLNDLENEYHIVIHTRDQTHYTPRADNFYLHVVPYDHYTLGEQIGFANFLRKLKPDLVHFTMPQQPLLYFGCRVTTIFDLTLVHFQNLDKNRFVYGIEQSIFKFLLKNVARRSKHIITATKFNKSDVAEYTGVPAAKITHIYGAEAPLQKLKPMAVSGLRGEDFIFYVGNAFPHKNLERLIRSFEQLKQKHPDLHLALAGKREFFYEQLEQKYGGVENLHFLGFVSDEQLAWMNQRALAYVFPSLSEGFGLPGIDAMQYGVPLVASNATCLPEVYGDAAHYFDPESIEDITRAIHEVLRSKHRREELVAAGYKQLEKYSWQKAAKQTRAVYMSALE